MGKINLQKVVVGGLIAGVVLNVIDLIMMGVVLKSQVAAAMAAIGKTAAMTTTQMVWLVVLDFAVGIFLVWLYAAVRPRFGAGPATAAKAGIAAWVIGSFLVNVFLGIVQVWPSSFLIISAIVGLVEFPLAAVIGAKFYTEGAGVGAGMGAGGGMGARM